jgi:hypothetical protein
MKKHFLVSLAVFFATVSFAQNVVSLIDPVSSKMLNPEKYSGIRGTPFLVDKWMIGTVTTTKGVYQNLELKFNVYDNALFFNKNDESFELQDDIVSFTLMPKPDDPASYLIYKRGITGADLKDYQYVQVLLEGNINLYKLDLKQLSEMSEINAGIVKTFTNNSKYYIGSNKNLQFIKLNKAEFLNALKDKQEQVQKYCSEKKISFKKDADFIEVLKYYNSL